MENKINNLVNVLIQEEVLTEEMSYEVNYEMLATAIVSYYMIEDILKNENNCQLIESIFFDSKALNKEKLSVLGLSKTSYYRKKQEYVSNFKLLLASKKYLKVQNLLENVIKKQKNYSVPKLGTNILDKLCYNEIRKSFLDESILSMLNIGTLADIISNSQEDKKH